MRKDWLTSFTTGRSQCVKVGSHICGYKELNCGVPQGSPLSCVLFLLYVQDLPLWVNGGQIQGYADDTMHFVTTSCPEETVKQLELGAKEILSYFASNELVANPSKTAFLMFRPSKNISEEMEANVGGTMIKESASERILGIQVQRTLEWDDHVKKVISKVNYGLSTMNQLQGFLRRKSLKAVAEGTVMSHLRYGIGVYLSGDICLSANSPVSNNLKKLQVKQNDALRTVLNKKRKDLIPRETLFKELGTKSVNQMAAEAVVMETWRSFAFRVDAISKSYSMEKSARRENLLRTSRNPNSFISKSASLWNSMSDQFRTLELTASGAKTEARKAASQLPMF